METSLTFSYESYDSILRNLREICHKSEIDSLKIFCSVIGQLKYDTFNGYKNIINLNLSRCDIHTLEQHVFDTLIHLKSINLSYNLIVLIQSSLFDNNCKLLIIILKNNFLNVIDNVGFANLQNLECLDLSSNLFSKLDDSFLKCQNLKELRLNNNSITDIDLTAFNELENLNYLSLNNNKIEKLYENTFKQLKNLRYLNLNDNCISGIDHNCFWELVNLQRLFLANNLLKVIISKFLFTYLVNLNELDLSGNQLSVTTNTFDKCRNLKLLKLAIRDRFDSVSIKHLTMLKEFEFIHKHSNFFLTSSDWFNLKSLTSLVVLKLIFQRLSSIRLCDFSHFTVMEYLHIECLEPSAKSRDFNLAKILPGLVRLKSLTFKKLNSFTVSQFGYGSKNLTYVNLCGVKNTILIHVVLCFSFIEYLDLSFSNIETIVEFTFRNLVNLEHLEFACSKLKSIDSVSFKYNYKLQILNCNHCRIETIESYSFANLYNLQLLDLSNNCLNTISDNIFYGLNLETCIIIL